MNVLVLQKRMSLSNFKLPNIDQIDCQFIGVFLLMDEKKYTRCIDLHSKCKNIVLTNSLRNFKVNIKQLCLKSTKKNIVYHLVITEKQPSVNRVYKLFNQFNNQDNLFTCEPDYRNDDLPWLYIQPLQNIGGANVCIVLGK